VLHSTTTLLFGSSGVGKSRLIAELVSSAVNGTPWCERQWNRKVDRVALVCTDAGAHREYGEYIRRTGLSRQYGKSIDVYNLELAPSDERWTELADEVLSFRPKLIVLDNITEAIRGSVNDDLAVTEVFKNLRKFGDVPLLIAAHTSKPSPDNPSRRNRTPLGSVAFSNLSRSKLHIREGYASDNADVTIEAKPRESAPYELHLTVTDDGRLVYASTSSAEGIQAGRKRQRRDTIARDRAIAEDVVANCRGMSDADISRYVARNYPKLTGAKNPEREIAKWLSQGRKFAALLPDGSRHLHAA